MKKSDKYDALKLNNQVCFPLYACSKELVSRYGPYLKKLGLTYTQYIVMMVMWEKETVSSRELAESLHLDYGDIEWFALEMKRDHSVTFKIASKYCISDFFVDYDGYSISSKGFLPAVVDIMVI